MVQPTDQATGFSRRSARSRVALGAVLGLAMGAGVLALFAVSVLAPFIVDDLGLSRSAYGLLPGALFFLGAAGSALIGRLGDRWDARSALLAVFAVGAVSWAGMGLAPTYPVFVVAIAIAAVPLALCIPATTHLVATHVPRGRQGVFIGIAQAGEQIGAFVVGLSLPVLALMVGWRATLLLLTVLAGLGLWATAATVPSRRVERTPVVNEVRSPFALSRRRLPILPFLCVYGFLLTGGGIGAVSYLPLYAFEALQLSPAVSGMVMSVVAVCATGGRLAWSRAAEVVRRPVLILVGVGAGSVVSIVAVAAAALAGPWLLWFGAIGFGATGMAWVAPAMMMVSRQVDPSASARVSGLIMFSSFLGAAAMPFAFGAVVDRIGGYGPAWLASAAIQLMATAAILAGLHVHGEAPDDARDKA